MHPYFFSFQFRKYLCALNVSSFVREPEPKKHLGVGKSKLSASLEGQGNIEWPQFKIGDRDVHMDVVRKVFAAHFLRGFNEIPGQTRVNTQLFDHFQPELENSEPRICKLGIEIRFGSGPRYIYLEQGKTSSIRQNSSRVSPSFVASPRTRNACIGGPRSFLSCTLDSRKRDFL